MLRAESELRPYVTNRVSTQGPLLVLPHLALRSDRAIRSTTMPVQRSKRSLVPRTQDMRASHRYQRTLSLPTASYKTFWLILQTLRMQLSCDRFSKISRTSFAPMDETPMSPRTCILVQDAWSRNHRPAAFHYRQQTRCLSACVWLENVHRLRLCGWGTVSNRINSANISSELPHQALQAMLI